MSLCLLQEHVPEDIETAQYTTYSELVLRFVEIGWPVLQNKLFLEEYGPSGPQLHGDDVSSAKYQCDDLEHP